MCMSGLFPHHEDGPGTLQRILKGSAEDNKFHQPLVSTWIPVEGRVEQTAEAAELFLAGKKEISSFRVDDYTFWVNQNWKEEHLTLKAKRRFQPKLFEETQETIEAYDALISNPENPVLRKEFMSELGDYVWTSTACASLLMIDTQRAASHYLLDELGVSDMRHTIGDIDKFVNEGYKPRLILSLYNEDDNLIWDLNPAQILTVITPEISSALIREYGDDDVDMLVGTPALSSRDLSTGQWYAKGLHFVAYWAHHHLDASLAEVIKQNILKIEGRVETNTVDKSDGARND